MNISKIIKERIESAEARFFSNDNIADFIKKGELDLLIDEVTDKLQTVFDSLIIDTKNDHNTKETAHRVAKMFVCETFSGRYEKIPKITAFPNANHYDELYVAGPITIRSTCAHHMMPIQGKCYIGVFPGKNVIGLSKFNRIVDWIVSRPTIQEEMTVQIADMVQKLTNAEGVAVLLQAEHGCMTMRGVKEHESAMVTSVMRGNFRDDKSLKEEFMGIVHKMP